MNEVRRGPVLFVINSMSGGGAERVMSRLLSLSRTEASGLEVALAILDRGPIAYPIPDRIKVWQLDSRGSLWRSVWSLRRLVKRIRPRLRLSFLTRANVANCLVGRFGGEARILSERINTTSHLGRGIRSGITKAIIRNTYPRADKIIAVSAGVAAELIGQYRVAAERVQVVPNPVDIESIRGDAAAPPSINIPDDYVFAMGRLTKSKNQAMLLRAFAAARLPGKLVIAGDGPERSALEALAKELGLADRIVLLGFVDNPYPILARARIFALASDVEGFPNALVEAMALNVPVIATNCPDGPAEILAGKGRDEISELSECDGGILVPCNDPALFAQGLNMLADEPTRSRVLAGAQRRLGEFEPQSVVRRYWQIIRAEMAS